MEPPVNGKGVHILTCSLQFGEKSRRLAIRTASAPGCVAVRITGGVKSLSKAAASNMHRTLVPAFSGCNYTFIAGGTRMIDRNTKAVLMGITEVLPHIGATNPQAKIVGVIPRQTDLRLVQCELVVSDETASNHYTIVHPDLTTCLLLQYSADRGLRGWDPEWKSALDLMEALRVEAHFRSLHLVYGGGPTTERELLHVAQLPHNPRKPWWVVLVSDSGGVAAEYAANKAFCDRFADRLVVCPAVMLRTTLQSLGFRPSQERPV